MQHDKSNINLYKKQEGLFKLENPTETKWLGGKPENLGATEAKYRWHCQ